MKALDREILRIALPSILAGITVPLVGMVDIAVAGHLDGGAAAFIGGISVGSMLFDLLYWNFYFLRGGTGGLTAQAFGRGDRRECARLLVRSVGLALAIALLVLSVRTVDLFMCGFPQNERKLCVPISWIVATFIALTSSVPLYLLSLETIPRSWHSAAWTRSFSLTFSPRFSSLLLSRMLMTQTLIVWSKSVLCR